VPHIICGGFDREETENALIDLHFLGINNVLVLQGDAIKNEPKFVPEPGGHHYASQLLQQVVCLNKGIYLDDDLQNVAPTDFCVGVAGYPEKHYFAPNLKTDLKYLKLKVDLGADYIVTQMFFDNRKYFEFVEKCREAGIKVPIIPGIKPITSKAQSSILAKTFHIDIPEDLADEIEQCKDNSSAKEVGIEWCIAQSKELMKHGVPTLHYYSMGKSDPVYRIAKALF
jgi:methylenetetrahydrofolate reductase (NADPH)